MQTLILCTNFAARRDHSKAWALRDIRIQQADAKSADLAVVAFQVRATALPCQISQLRQATSSYAHMKWGTSPNWCVLL